MDAGLPRLESEAHGRIASAVAKTKENRASSDKKQQIPAFRTQFHRLDRLKTDRLLALLCDLAVLPALSALTRLARAASLGFVSDS